MGFIRAVTYFVFFACTGAKDNSFMHIGNAFEDKTTIVRSFLRAVEEGRAAEVNHLLRVNPQLIRFRDRRAATILMKASNLSDATRAEEMARLLLDAGAQATIGAIDRGSMTALMYAAQRGHLAIAALLLERPASATSSGTVKDATPQVNALLKEIENGHLAEALSDDGLDSSQVRKLRASGGVTGADAAGQTALMKAGALEDEEKSLEATKLLLHIGAQAVINVVDYTGKSALEHAAANRNFKTCQLLRDNLGSLGPHVSFLPPKDLFQVTNLTELNRTKLRCKHDSMPDVCKHGRFFCFDPGLFEKRFGELEKGRGETTFRGFANGRSGWIRVFQSYNTYNEDCGCTSCGRWDPASTAADGDWTVGDVILHQATNYWPAGSRVRIVKGSRYSHHHADEGTCATLTSNLYEGAGYQEVGFDDGFNYTYEFEDLEPCSEVMPFDVEFGECTTDADHCVLSPNFPKDYSNSSECGIRIKTSATLHAVSYQAEEDDSLYWQLEAPLNRTAELAWTGALSSLGVEPTDEKHSVSSSGQKFKPFQAAITLVPWLHWSSDGAGTDKGWRICEALIDWKDINGETAVMKAIDNGSNQALKVLGHLLKSRADVEGSNKTGQTPLMKACEQPDNSALQAVDLLFRESNAQRTLRSVDDRSRTALMYAVMQCNIKVVRKLLGEAKELTKELTKHVDCDGKGALLHAVEHCSVEMVEELVEALGGTSEAAAEMQNDTAGKTTIMYAAERPNVDLLKYLISLYGGEAPRILTSSGKVVSLKMYADFVNRRDNESRSALSYAAKYGNLEAIRLLKDHGALIADKSASGKTVLMYAVESGNTTTVKYLLETRAMKQLLDETDNDNRTALMYAANFSDNTTKILLNKSADISARDAKGMSVLMYAAQGGNANVVKTILEPVKRDGMAFSDGKQLARVLVDADPATPADIINWTDEEGATALMYASKVDPEDNDTNSTEVIELLVKHRADVGRSNTCNFSPLMAAAQRGYLRTVQTLLDACNNDPAIMNDQNGGWGRKPLESCDSPSWGMPMVWGQWRTALWLAAERGHVEVVEELARRNADVLIRDRERMLPIEVARKSGHTAVTEHLRLMNPPFREQVTRTLHFRHFHLCVFFAFGFSVVFVVLFVCVQICCGKRGCDDDVNNSIPPRGAILLAARAVRFRQKDDKEDKGPKARNWCSCCRATHSTSSRKFTYALNVCANVLMPFGPLMYFTNPDFVAMWWFALYFVLPVFCAICKPPAGPDSDAKKRVKEVLLKLWQAPSLAMTGKYLYKPWITRWLRPRLLIFLVTWSELIMRLCGRPINRPSLVLVFEVETFRLYTIFLTVISLGAVLWRTNIIPLMADICTLLWVTFGTQCVTHSQMHGPVAVLISLLLPSYPLGLYWVHIYMEGKKDPGKVRKKWWDDQQGYSSEIDGLVEEIGKYTEAKPEEQQKLRLELEKKHVNFWHFSKCRLDKDFGCTERLLFFAFDMWFDFQTIVLLMLADRFYFAGVMLFVCISSSILHFLLWLCFHFHRRANKTKPPPAGDFGDQQRCEGPDKKADVSGRCWWLSCFFINAWKGWKGEFKQLGTGVPSVTFLKWTDRAHGFQDFFSLCVTLRSLPLIGKEPLVMVLQMVSIAMSTWGLTTFLFEKIELEVTESYYDQYSFHRLLGR